MNYTHLTNFDKRFNKIELISNEDETRILVNGKEVLQSSGTGHEFTGKSLFQNSLDLIGQRFGR